MSTTYYTKEPILSRDFDPKKRTDLIWQEKEMNYDTAAQHFRKMVAAFRAANVQEGDIVYVTVCYEGGHYKPGNFRNMKQKTHYEFLDDLEVVDLRTVFE